MDLHHSLQPQKTDPRPQEEGALGTQERVRAERQQQSSSASPHGSSTPHPPPTWFLTAGTLQSRSCLLASLSADQEINWSLSNSCIPLPEQSCGSSERLPFSSLACASPLCVGISRQGRQRWTHPGTCSHGALILTIIRR